MGRRENPEASDYISGTSDDQLPGSEKLCVGVSEEAQLVVCCRWLAVRCANDE